MRASSGQTRPPLKWAGGKYQILEHLKKRLPSDGGRLIEPFVGSGAVFLNTDFKRYTLNDSNHDLIAFYRLLKKDCKAFIERCRRFFTPHYNNAERYYRLRDEFNATDDGVLKSALFLYLNRHGYNGLCRYNASGQFNTPFGLYDKPHFPELELRAFSQKSRCAKLTCWDFERVMKQARPEDAIYCDPPYVRRSRTSNFTSYNAGNFDMDAHIRLANAAYQAAQQGTLTLISNHANESTRKIYRRATRLYHFNVRRTISCKGGKRERAKELLALYLPASDSL